MISSQRLQRDLLLAYLAACRLVTCLWPFRIAFSFQLAVVRRLPLKAQHTFVAFTFADCAAFILPSRLIIFLPLSAFISIATFNALHCSGNYAAR